MTVYLAVGCLAAVLAQLPPVDLKLDQNRCGAYALFVALQSLNLGPSSVDELVTAMGNPGPDGFSMAELEQHAARYGAKTLVVRTTVENLKARRRPFACVTQTRANHWVVLADLKESVAVIIDPPGISELPLATFRRVWLSECLLIGSSPLESEESVTPRSPTLLILGIVIILGLAVSYSAVRIARRRLVPKFGAPGTALAIALAGAASSGCDTTPLPSLNTEKWVNIEPEVWSFGKFGRPIAESMKTASTFNRNVTDREFEPTPRCTETMGPWRAVPPFKPTDRSNAGLELPVSGISPGPTT